MHVLSLRPAVLNLLCLGPLTLGFAADPAPPKSTAGLDLVWCKPGTFVMGSPADEAERNDSETPHQITLTKGFWISRYEVTQAIWARVMNQGGPDGAPEAELRLPQEVAERTTALEFCEKLTQLEQRAGTVSAGWHYTLPTEAQWEYACRAGTTTAYAFGPQFDPDNANTGTVESAGWMKERKPVGSYPPNPWGIFDMHGNVAEYCLDVYAKYPDGPATAPAGPAKKAPVQEESFGGFGGPPA